MAIETPTALTPNPPVPDDTVFQGDAFNEAAENWLDWQIIWSAELADLSTNVYNNALEAEGFAQTASAAAGSAANAQNAAEGFRDQTQVLRDETSNIVANIPEGTINDTITTNTDTWSSSKISTEIANAGAIDSVNGQTGVVVLDKTDVGLGDVDNTSDVDKLINASNLNTGTVPSARLPNASTTDVGGVKMRLNGADAFITFNGVDA